MNKFEGADYIDHEGIVTFIDQKANLIKVRIDDLEECGDCPVVETCEHNGKVSNEVSIITPEAYKYQINDIVMVRGTEKLHRKAIMYATVLPCIMLVAVMVGLYLLTGNQLVAALSGLGVTILFFFLLWLARNKIAHEFTFSLVGEIERHGNEK